MIIFETDASKVKGVKRHNGLGVLNWRPKRFRDIDFSRPQSLRLDGDYLTYKYHARGSAKEVRTIVVKIGNSGAQMSLNKSAEAITFDTVGRGSIIKLTSIEAPMAVVVPGFTPQNDIRAGQPISSSALEHVRIPNCFVPDLYQTLRRYYA